MLHPSVSALLSCKLSPGKACYCLSNDRCALATKEGRSQHALTMLHSSFSASNFGAYFSPAYHRSATPLSYISCLDIAHISTAHQGVATVLAHGFSVRPACHHSATFPSGISLSTSGIVTALVDVTYLPEY